MYLKVVIALTFSPFILRQGGNWIFSREGSDRQSEPLLPEIQAPHVWMTIGRSRHHQGGRIPAIQPPPQCRLCRLPKPVSRFGTGHMLALVTAFPVAARLEPTAARRLRRWASQRAGIRPLVAQVSRDDSRACASIRVTSSEEWLGAAGCARSFPWRGVTGPALSSPTLIQFAHDLFRVREGFATS